MPSHYNKQTTGENHAHTKPSKEDTLWHKMKTDIMKNKSKKKRWNDIEKAMRDAGM